MRKKNAAVADAEIWICRDERHDGGAKPEACMAREELSCRGETNLDDNFCMLLKPRLEKGD